MDADASTQTVYFDIIVFKNNGEILSPVFDDTERERKELFSDNISPVLGDIQRKRKKFISDGVYHLY